MIFGVPVETTKDLLYLSLSGGFILIAILLVLVLIRVFRLLGNIHAITESVADIIDVVSTYLWKPVQLLNAITKKIKAIIKARSEKK